MKKIEAIRWVDPCTFQFVIRFKLSINNKSYKMLSASYAWPTKEHSILELIDFALTDQRLKPLTKSEQVYFIMTTELI